MLLLVVFSLHDFYITNFEEVEGHIGFGPVCLSPTLAYGQEMLEIGS